MSQVISKNVKNYLAQIENQASKGFIEGYFSVDVVIDAFNKGEERGAEKALENFKDNFLRRSMQMFFSGNDLIADLEKEGYKTTEFYVNPVEFKFLITTPVENTYDEKFINLFFERAYKYEQKFREEFKEPMKMLFIRDEGVNVDELSLDGFFKLTDGEA